MSVWFLEPVTCPDIFDTSVFTADTSLAARFVDTECNPSLSLDKATIIFFVVPACHELVLDGSINIFKLSML